ncbi:flagella basal body P-ring formation protein FlgA [Kangiella sp. HZ709]|uniref:flagella basal body P-ring formation protein FlgA n=1 Tax=Kangiella sp. HZ709 TaxID=2666328 RepID=UPI0012AF741F|nr:flagella basal body P-ring formation protein FlgA [Kangiella sp. HZ709]MRX26856.1 hypothetical protein [Kangiella sp. HZ709]
MKLKLFLLISLLFCIDSLNAKAVITGSFKVHHYPADSQVELVDLVYLRGEEAVIKKIKEIVISTSDHPSFIDVSTIKSYLSGYDITWRGKGKIYQRATSQSKVKLLEISAKAKQCLTDKLNELGFLSSVSGRTSFSDGVVVINSKTFSLACEILNAPTKEQVAKAVGVKVKLLNDTKSLVSRTFWFDIKLELTVLRINKNLKKNESILIEDLEESIRISKGLSRKLITADDIISGKYVAKKEIAKGSLLFAGDLAPTPLVFDSMASTLIHNKNGFEVKLKVVAHKNGYLNDLVEVTVPSSNEMLLAKVTGDRELTLYEK